MTRVRFIADFDYKPTRRMTIAYRAGSEMTVKRDCARKAIAAGKAIEINPAHTRGKPDGENSISG